MDEINHQRPGNPTPTPTTTIHKTRKKIPRIPRTLILKKTKKTLNNITGEVQIIPTSTKVGTQPKIFIHLTSHIPSSFFLPFHKSNHYNHYF